jgi:hypothetical protein
VNADLNRLVPELPDGLRSIAFRAVEQVLREDPVLSGVVKTWRTLEGRDDDTQEVGWDNCPLIALSPSPQPDRKLTHENANVTMVIYVEVYAPGTCVDDMLNLWDAVGAALKMRKPYRGSNVQDFLRCGLQDRGLSILDLNLIEPAFLAWLPGKRVGDQLWPSIQKGLGTIGFFFERPR